MKRDYDEYKYTMICVSSQRVSIIKFIPNDLLFLFLVEYLKRHLETVGLGKLETKRCGSTESVYHLLRSNQIKAKSALN